jgi:hypothetical protein
MIQSYQGILVSTIGDGAAITAAARTTLLPAHAIITLPNHFFYVGKAIKITAHGRISCVITTPGTARFDVAVGAIVALDSLALNLNIVAKTNVPWLVEMILFCRAIGNGVNSSLFGYGTFQSEAVIASPLPTVGGNGSLLFPVAAPAVGALFDNSLANTLNLFFTQTVATGSITLHNYKVEELN